MVTLYDVLKRAKYYQVFHIYLSNDWDDNIFVGRGTRSQLLAQEMLDQKSENITFDYLNNDIELLYTIGFVMVILVKDEDHNQPVEQIWNKDIRTYNDLMPLLKKKFVSLEEIDKIAAMEKFDE